MKAAVLHAAPGTPIVEDVEIDDPGPGEVLVRTAAAGVCHSDVHFAEGRFATALPAILGHEAAGVVEAVGPDVGSVRVGDHVVVCLSLFCGHCRYCLTGRPFMCAREGLGRGPEQRPRLSSHGRAVHPMVEIGSFAELMLVHEHALVTIPRELPLRTAALFGCAVVTGLGAVFNTAAVRPGETVAVIGCGGIGLNCVQGALLAGAARVIAVDPIAEKRRLADELGATDTIDPSAVDAVEAVRELTGGGVDHAFEAVGLPATARDAFEMVDRGGTATVIGLIDPTASIDVSAAGLLRGKRIQGSVMGSNRFRVDIPRYIDLYLAGRLRIDELVTRTIRLDDLGEAFAELTAGRVTRQVVVFE